MVVFTTGSPRVSLGSDFLSTSTYWDAFPLFDLVREASEAPSGTAHEEQSLQVMVVPSSRFPIVPIAPCIPASSSLSLFLVSCSHRVS